MEFFLAMINEALQGFGLALVIISSIILFFIFCAYSPLCTFIGLILLILFVIYLITKKKKHTPENDIINDQCPQNANTDKTIVNITIKFPDKNNIPTEKANKKE